MTGGLKETAPRYPIPWIATYFLTALVLIVGSFVMVWYVNQPASKFDYDDPDMTFLESIVLSEDPRRGDFTLLNGGDWRALCFVGWKGNVGAALARAGVAQADARLIRAAQATAREDVAQTEFALVYVNGQGTAKAVHHPHGFAFAREGAAACTSKDNPVLELPAGR